MELREKGLYSQERGFLGVGGLEGLFGAGRAGPLELREKGFFGVEKEGSLWSWGRRVSTVRRGVS